MKRHITMMLLSGILLSGPGWAQAAEDYRSEASIQALGSFGKTTTENGVQHSDTNSGGVLLSYRYYFAKNHGVEINYGWFQNTQRYGLNSGPAGVKANAHELTAAYVVRYTARRVSPFALAGVGALFFDPRNEARIDSLPNIDPTTQPRPAFLYGGGADFKIAEHVSFRAGYRGLVYNSPNFDTPALKVDRLTHRAEPFGGLVIRF